MLIDKAPILRVAQDGKMLRESLKLGTSRRTRHRHWLREHFTTAMFWPRILKYKWGWKPIKRIDKGAPSHHQSSRPFSTSITPTSNIIDSDVDSFRIHSHQHALQSGYPRVSSFSLCGHGFRRLQVRRHVQPNLQTHADFIPRGITVTSSGPMLPTKFVLA